MKTNPFPLALFLAFIIFISGGSELHAGTPEAKPATLVENFETALSPEWFWGLGTWKAEGGILRGFESGSRRHGPVKMRRFTMRDGTLECELRLSGKATFAGVIFNGSQERGHIVHLVVGKDQIRLIAHPRKGEVVELLKVAHSLSLGEWHRVKLQFRGETLTASVDEVPLIASHACLAEQKVTFGLGGDSGGPSGEAAGTLEFRRLKASNDTSL